MQAKGDKLDLCQKKNPKNQSCFFATEKFTGNPNPAWLGSDRRVLMWWVLCMPHLLSLSCTLQISLNLSMELSSPVALSFLTTISFHTVILTSLWQTIKKEKVFGIFFVSSIFCYITTCRYIKIIIKALLGQLLHWTLWFTFPLTQTNEYIYTYIHVCVCVYICMY